MTNTGALNLELRGFCQGAVAGLASFLIAASSDRRLTPVPGQAFLGLANAMMYGQRAEETET